MKINLSQCCPLFSGISENEMDKLLSCLDARERRYQKGELVISAGTKISRFGVLLSGTVEIQQEDFQGNITIVAQITPGQLFAEAFVGAGAALPVAVLSTEPSVILWLDYNKLLSPCQYACPFHAAVIKNMVKILANKNIFLNISTFLLLIILLYTKHPKKTILTNCPPIQKKKLCKLPLFCNNFFMLISHDNH